MAFSAKIETGMSLWISLMLKMKRSFMLLSSNVTSVDVTCEDPHNTFALIVRCASNFSLGRSKPHFQAGTLERQVKMLAISRRGAP